MEENKKFLLKSYISNVQVCLTAAGYTHVWEDWRDIDYVPQYNKFYFICDGEGWLKIGEREFHPKPGQMFLMPAGVIQSYSTISKNTFIKYWCHFTATIGDVNIFDVIQLPYSMDVKDRRLLERLFHDLIKHNESCEMSAPLKVKSLLLEIIAHFIENTVVENINLSTSNEVEKLNSVLNHINRNLSRNFTIEQLAQIAHFHPNYFIRFFRKHMGISPMHYINKMRIEKAKRLLDSTGLTVTEIADSVGIYDVYYLSRLFKDYTGFSPTEYRKKKYLSNGQLY